MRNLGRTAAVEPETWRRRTTEPWAYMIAKDGDMLTLGPAGLTASGCTANANRKIPLSMYESERLSYWRILPFTKSANNCCMWPCSHQTVSEA